MFTWSLSMFSPSSSVVAGTVPPSLSLGSIDWKSRTDLRRPMPAAGHSAPENPIQLDGLTGIAASASVSADFAASGADSLGALRRALYAYYGSEPGENHSLSAPLAALLDRRAFDLHAKGFTPEKLAALEPTLQYRDGMAQAGQASIAFVPFAVMGFLSRYFASPLVERYGPWGGQALAGAIIGGTARALAPVFDTSGKADVYYGKVPNTALLEPAALDHLDRKTGGTARKLLAASAGFAVSMSARNLVRGGAQVAMAAAGFDAKKTELVSQVLDAALLLTMSGPLFARVDRKIAGDDHGLMAVLLARKDCLQLLEGLQREQPAGTVGGIAQRAQKLGQSAWEFGRALTTTPAKLSAHVVAPGTIGELLLVAGLVTIGGNVTDAVRKSMAAQGHSAAVQELITQLVGTLVTMPLFAGFPLASAGPGLAMQALSGSAPQTDVASITADADADADAEAEASPA